MSMQSVQNRLSSFTKPKRVKNGSKAATVFKWPHSSRFKATPETLAEAGFYFDPSVDDKDNVTCYMCEKQLSDWDEEDDPFDIHYNKCYQQCHWANVRCGLRLDMDSQGRWAFSNKNRIPTSKAMEKARLETFIAGSGWPHDEVKNHGASSKKMARAGFVFTPQDAGDDLATCLYCNVSLSGWDEGDDPMEEHRARVEKKNIICPLFTPSTSTKPASKSTAKPKYTDLEMPIKTYDGEDEDDTSEAPTRSGSTAKTPRKPKAAGKGAKTPRARARSRSRARSEAPSDEEEEEEEEVITVPAPRAQRKSTHARSRSTSRAPPAPIEDEDDDPEPVAPKKTAKSKSKAKAVVETDDDENAEVAPPPKISRAKSKAKAVEEPEPETEVEEAPAPKAKPLSRKPSSRAVTKAVEAEEEVVEAPPAKPLSRKPSSRTVSRSKAKAPPAIEDAPEPVVAGKRSSSRTTSKSTKPKPPPAEPIAEPSEDELELPPPPARSRKASKPQDVEDVQDTGTKRPASRATSHRSRSRPPSPVLELDEGEIEAYLPPPPPPTAAHSKPRLGKARVPERKPQSSGDNDEEDVPSPPPPRATSRKPSKTVPKQKIRVPTPEPEPEPEMDVDESMESPPSPPPAPVQAPSKKASKAKPKQMVDSAIEDDELFTSASQPAPSAPSTVQKGGRKPLSQSTSRSVKSKPQMVVEPDVFYDAPSDVVTDEEDEMPVVDEAPEVAAPSAKKKKAKPFLDDAERVKAPFPPAQRQVSRSKTRGDTKEIDSVVAEAPKPQSKKIPDNTTATVASTAGQKPLPQAKEKPTGKNGNDETARPGSGSNGERKEVDARAKVVEISSDDEDGEEEMDVQVVEKGKPKQGKATTKLVSKTMATPHTEEAYEDADMADVDEDPVAALQFQDPVTPPRRAAPLTPALPKANHTADRDTVEDNSGFQFFPPLSQEPFVNLENWTEDDMNMTVEQWIHHQIGLEYEKFKKDGERQLAAFERRAEEVRSAIEAL